MRLGIASLMLGYVLSQFYRAFLAVLAPVLELELALSKQDLASASGWWFLAFSVMQLPVGVAFDKIGPRITTTICLAIAAFGAAMFAMANGAFDIKIAMALIGIGCSPILVASYFIFAREFPAAMFGTLAGMTVGIGSLGDILGSLPLALLAETMGWRGAIWIMVGVTLATMIGVFLMVKDPERLGSSAGGSLWTVIAMPQMWPIFAMMLVCYATPSALRGLWLGPYFHDVWLLDRAEIGLVGMAMGLGLVTGSLAIGPIARRVGSAKWTAVVSNAVMLAATALLWAFADSSFIFAVVLFVTIGVFGSTFPVITAHARSFIPPQVMGRGVTFVNLCGMISVGIAQQITGALHTAKAGADVAAPFAAVFGFFAATTVVGLTIYLFASEKKV